MRAVLLRLRRRYQIDSAVNTARYSRLNSTNGEDTEKAPGDAAHQRRLIGKAQRTAPACVWWRRSLRPMAGRRYFPTEVRSAAKSGCPPVREPVARTERNVL